MKEKINTCIPGLDELITGGIPRGHVILISGLPGTMKSSLAYNILFNNAKQENRRGLYISLEQGRESLTDHMTGLGMNHSEVESLVNIVDMGYLRLHMDEQSAADKSWMDIFKLYAENMHDSMEYELLVIDSLPVVELMSKMQDRRNELFHFFGWLRELGVTTFIVAEATEEPRKVLEEDFLSDGIIRVRKERHGQDIARIIYIDKMRGAKHNTSLFTLLHDGKEFQLTRAIGQ